MIDERLFDPMGILVGSASGVVAYLAATVGAVPYATDAAGSYRALVIIYGAVFVVGLCTGLISRKRLLSKKGLCLTGGGAGVLAGGVIAMLVVSTGADHGSINVAAALQTFVLMLVLMTVGTIAAGWPWRRARSSELH